MAKGLREDAQDAARLADQLRAAKEQLRSLQEIEAKGGSGEAFAEAYKEATKNVEELTDALKSLKKAQEDSAKSAAKASKEREKYQSDTEKFIRKTVKSVQEGISIAKGVARGDSESIDKALSAGGKALEAGAVAATKAAAALASAAVAVTTGIVKLGIESTAAADKQRRALGYLTRGFGESTGKGRGVVQGDLAYRVTLALAGEKGVEPDVALSRMKKLIDAKFGRADTELLFRVSADLGEVKGDGAAEALLGQLEAIKRIDAKVKDARDLRGQRAAEFERGGAQASALDKFAESGIKASEVLGLLAQKGEDLRHVSLRLRRGKIDADEFARAVAQVAGKDVVGAAGKGLDATLNLAKIGLRSLFEGWDLSPIDDLGKKLDEALKSKSGKDLKKSIDEVGAAVLSVIKNISADDIASFFTSAAQAAHALAEAIRAARDMASDLVKVGKDIGLIGEKAERVQRPIHEVELEGGKTGVRAVKTEEDAEAAGKAFDEGLAKGIDANLDKVKAAGARAGKAAEAGSKDALDIRSPSGVGKDIGRFYNKGIEEGIDASAAGPMRAAARTAAGVVGVGVAGGASGAGGGESAPGVSIQATYAPVINLPAGTPQGMVDQLRSALADDYAGRFLPWTRQVLRDAREQATGGG